MNWRKLIMRLAVEMIVIGAFVGGCSYINQKFGLEDDNIAEEFIERQIEQEIGLDIDLSPESPEK